MTAADPESSVKSVPVQINESVPLDELGHSVISRRYISEHKIKEIAVEKYRSSGKGIIFNDVRQRFSVKKAQAQRSLKHFHAQGVLFTAQDLINQGIDLADLALEENTTFFFCYNRMRLYE